MKSHTRRWVLPVLIASLIVSVGCQSGALSARDIKPVQIIRQYEGHDPGLRQPGITVVNSRRELQALGSVRLAANQFDFQHESLIVFALGERPTSGYWVNIDAVQKNNDALYIQGLANRPSSDQRTATVKTYPYSAVVVPKVKPTTVLREIRSTTGLSSPTAIVQVPTNHYD